MTARRNALVTGASRGIGLAIARRLAADGFDLTISARSRDALDAQGTALSAHGGRVDAVVADMANEQDVIDLAAATLQQTSSLDVLVLSAGVGFAGPLASLPMRRFDTQMTVNVRAPLALVQLLLPALRTAAGVSEFGAKVVAIASITGMAAEPELGAYSASKSALISLCESITIAEGTNGVSATAISPGYVDTDMSRAVRGRIDPATMITGGDVAELVACVTRLSRWAAVPNIPVTRPGPQLWRA